MVHRKRSVTLRRAMAASLSGTVWDASTPIPAGAKVIHFIRHGEGVSARACVCVRPLPPCLWTPGQHNLAVAETGSTEEYKNWAWYDSRYVNTASYRWGGVGKGLTCTRLTPKGVSQAKALQPRVDSIPVDVVYVSTLSRAIQTGLNAFELVSATLCLALFRCGSTHPPSPLSSPLLLLSFPPSSSFDEHSTRCACHLLLSCPLCVCVVLCPDGHPRCHCWPLLLFPPCSLVHRRVCVCACACLCVCVPLCERARAV